VHLYGYLAVHGGSGALWIPDSDRYSNQNNAARVFGVVVIVGAFYMTAPLGRWRRVLAAGVALAALLLCLLTRSASALGALLLLALCLPLLVWGRQRPLLLGAIYGGLCAAGILLLANGGIELAGGWSRRDVIWLAALERLPEMPWYGFGIPLDEQVSGIDGITYGHLHNLLLSVLLYSGYPGLALVLGYVALLLVRVIRFPERHHVMLGALLLYGLLALLTSGKYPLTRPNDAWLLFWVPLLMLSVKSFLPLSERDSCR
jgi:O-antigen ligase